MASYFIDSKSGLLRTGELSEILSKAQGLVKSAARPCTCQPGTCACTAPSASRSQKCLKVRVDTEENAKAGVGEKRGRWPRNKVGACCAMLVLCLVIVALSMAMVMYASRSALFPFRRSLSYLIGNGIKVADSCSDVGVGMSCATPCESSAYSVCPLSYQEQGLPPAVLSCPWGSVCSTAREGVVGCVPRDTCAVSADVLAPDTVRSPAITNGQLNEVAPPPKEAIQDQHPELERVKERKPVSVGLAIFDFPVRGWQRNRKPKMPRKSTKPADTGHKKPTAPEQPEKPIAPEQPNKPGLPEQPEKPIAPEQPNKPGLPGQQPQNQSDGQSGGEVDNRKIPVKPDNKSPDRFGSTKDILG
ncbi:uncharacterized protein LOC106173464 isoform X2 [Lingula anatina]|uniref:Uncharacterized protein LOC106173464 isoform X2 n=1 Tax=Lingula anatina TaxID=7574 RepID=A0A1S3JI11_LINAN|nr:uncharacterized protein LOC106173464 isoform X2 [Lingula anatina]|eukprot:XP_013410055.1 uncharacterized protein LOC106173464 isoform X2 [Lingula anatina]